jgi:membrane-bound metal-dependent hydrolase YbcI (DUF457 family)
MPGFKIHISASTTLGIAYGAGAAIAYDVPLPTCALAATLCSVSGMLPDLDADGGTPLHESVAFAAAAVPVMLDDRFRQWGWTHESIILAGALVYLFIRFVLCHVLQHFTVHRGIFHSLPVALIFTEIAFLVCTTGDINVRYYKAGGVLLGFMSHLILDEIWSIDLRHFRLKSSFGTALKLWSESKIATGMAYLIVAFTTLLVLHDPVWVNVSPEAEEMHVIATRLIDQIYK